MLQSKWNKRLTNPWLCYGILILASIIPYLNRFGNTFVLDDFDFIVNWPLIRDWKNLPQFFVGYQPPPGQEGIYSPLKTVFHAVNYHLFGLNPLGHHVVAILIHILGIVFVYKIGCVLLNQRLAPWLGAVLFAVHPVHVEAITVFTASVDSLGVAFLFISFYYYIQSQENKGKYVLSLIFALIAVFTHELNIVLPLLFGWYDYSLRKPKLSIKTILIKILPFFIIVFAYALCKHFVLGSVTRGQYVYGSFYLTMLITLKVWAKYVLICFFPNVLTHNHIISNGIYSFDQEDFNRFAVLSQSILDPQVLLSFALIVACFYVMKITWRNRPFVAFCVGWFFISLLPGSNIIPSGVYFAERYLYLATLGFCLLFGWVFERGMVADRTIQRVPVMRACWMLFAAVLVLFTARCLQRNPDWKNDITLFESAVRANPQSALMRNDLGLNYLKFDQPQKALEKFHEALTIRHDDPVTYFSMAEAYIQLEQHKEAEASLKKAIELNPKYADAYYNLAGLYALSNKHEDARKQLNLAMQYFKDQGRAQEAEELKQTFINYFYPMENPEIRQQFNLR